MHSFNDKFCVCNLQFRVNKKCLREEHNIVTGIDLLTGKTHTSKFVTFHTQSLLMYLTCSINTTLIIFQPMTNYRELTRKIHTSDSVTACNALTYRLRVPVKRICNFTLLLAFEK